MQGPIKRALAAAGGCAIVFSPLLLSGRADAAALAHVTYYVAGNGSDSHTGASCPTGFATIAHAISVAGSGDTIIVCPSGTPYAQGNVVVPPGKNLTIMGRGHPVINATGKTNGIVVEANETTIEDLTVENANNAGIEVEHVLHGLISRNDLMGNTDGILILDSSYVDVLDNLTHDNSQAGIVLSDTVAPAAVAPVTPDALPVFQSAHNVVSKNIADHNGGQGILLIGYLAAPSGVFDNKVISNTTDSNGFDISALHGPAGILLTSGTPVGNVFRNLIASNEAEGNAGPGISLIAGAVVSGPRQITPDKPSANLNRNVITKNALGINNVGVATGGPDTETTGIYLSSPAPLVAHVYDNLVNGDFYGTWATNTIGPKLLFFNNVFLGVVVPVFIA